VGEIGESKTAAEQKSVCLCPQLESASRSKRAKSQIIIVKNTMIHLPSLITGTLAASPCPLFLDLRGQGVCSQGLRRAIIAGGEARSKVRL